MNSSFSDMRSVLFQSARLTLLNDGMLRKRKTCLKWDLDVQESARAEFQKPGASHAFGWQCMALMGSEGKSKNLLVVLRSHRSSGTREGTCEVRLCRCVCSWERNAAGEKRRPQQHCLFPSGFCGHPTASSKTTHCPSMRSGICRRDRRRHLLLCPLLPFVFQGLTWLYCLCLDFDYVEFYEFQKVSTR